MFPVVLSKSAIRNAVFGRRLAHTVRVILTQDIDGGEGYSGDVVRVRAGYARNKLIPQKLALYATPENFARLKMSDPDSESLEERRERQEREKELAEEGGEELKQADLLKRYLRNKVLRIWRRVDPNTNDVHPGMVDQKAVRAKLSKQLKIDLEPHERVHLRPEPLHDEDADELEALFEDIQTEEDCKVQIRALGVYLAKISLAGGYTVPLKVEVLKR